MSSGSDQSSSSVQQVTPTYTSGMGTSTTGTQQTFTPWAPVQPSYDALAAQMNAQAALGPQYVQASAPTQQAWNTGQQAANSYLQAAQGMAGVLPAAQTNYNSLSNAADVANNPYVQGMMAANTQQANENLTQSLLPTLQSGAIDVNALGSSRLGLAQGQAVADTATGLANTNAALMMDAYGQGLTAQQQALAQTGALQAAYGAPAAAQAQAALGLGQIGASQEGYTQNRLNAPWQYIQNLGAAQQYTNPLGVLSGTGTSQEVSSSAPQGYYDPATGGVAAPAATPAYSTWPLTANPWQVPGYDPYNPWASIYSPG